METANYGWSDAAQKEISRRALLQGMPDPYGDTSPSAPSGDIPPSPAPAPVGAPTWGNKGGTPQSDPWQNYATPAASATTTPAPTATPALTGQGLIDAFWSQVTQQGRQSLTPQELDQILANPQMAGITRLGPDKVQLPNGQIVDVIGDVGGRNSVEWSISGGQPGQNGQPMSVGGAGGVGLPGAGASGMAGSAASSSSSTSGVDPQLQQALRDQLLKIMGQGQPSIGDPTLAPQSAAYAAARNRGAQNERAALAERAAFTGLNSGGQGSGAFDTGIQGIQENAGQDIAANDASLVGQEVQARRAQLMQALDLANAVGARTEATALQRELASMDNQYRYSALNENARQSNNQLGFNYDQLQAVLDRQALLDAMGGGA